MTGRMTGPELREALRSLGLTSLELSRLIGAPERRVLRWLHDEEATPRWLRSYCAAMTVPEAKALALASRAGPWADAADRKG